jgi:hypothetical protein
MGLVIDEPFSIINNWMGNRGTIDIAHIAM